MRTALWIVLAAVALLWPAAIAGPLDGAPLDAPLEAIVIGVIVPWLFAAAPNLLRHRGVRALILALLAWKAVSGAVVTPDGWCLRFVAPVPVYVDDVLVPHSWDVRADWRAAVPRCSAIMTTNYPVLERFPAWFYNLPPANHRNPVGPNDRPPGATLQFDLGGFLQTRDETSFQVVADEDVQLSATIDGQSISHDALRGGVALAAGSHEVRVHGDLRRTHWSLHVLANGAPVWTTAIATMDPPSRLDAWVRPAGRYISGVIVAAILGAGLLAVLPAAGVVVSTAAALATALFSMVAATALEGVIRALPCLLIATIGLPFTRRTRGHLAHLFLIGLPLLAIFMALGWSRAGIFTWYSSGDDWWTFQRFAYRIYMQGHWLQGGEPTFYFQPLYRWIAGALHLAFGDSSVGELFWDAAAVLVGATFSFHFVKAVAGPRWAYTASVLTLALYTVGPGWYLFGRGLSELTSAGFIYGAALAALRGRRGSASAIVMAGVLSVLAFYTRLNNLPIALAVSLFALPARTPTALVWSAASLWRSASKPVVLGVLGSLAVGLHLFTLRTWYYTGVYSMLHGTSTGINTMWKVGESLLQSMTSSVLMMLTMNDPPRFDLRAIPLLVAPAVALLGCFGVRPFTRLPLSAAVMCLAGVSSALIVRGTSYPGRFSVHLIPIAAVVTVCAVFELAGRPRAAGLSSSTSARLQRSRFWRRAHQSPATLSGLESRSRMPE